MMKLTRSFSICILSFSVILYSCGHSVRNIHRTAVVVDTHNDFISKSVENGFVFDQDNSGKTHSDLNRMIKGGIDIQIFSIFGGEDIGFAHANKEMDTLYAVIARNPSKIRLVKTPADLDQAVKEKKLGAMIGVEGGHMIENDLANLEKLYERGARYMTLTWNNSTPWASSAADESAGKIPQDKKGLNEFGIEVVKKMNALGMMVDLSHVGEQTFVDALSVTTKPVIASHSSVHKLAPVPRNLKDYQIAAIGQNKGVICVNFYSGFLDSTYLARKNDLLRKHKTEVDSLRKTGMSSFSIDDHLFVTHKHEVEGLRPPLSVLIDHIDHIVKKIGVDHVGLGSDFDGIESAPKELDTVKDFPKITKALKKRGYSQKDIKKILGENLIRVFRENSN
ncbi:MAG TPA: dipeptidase [Chitinophagaceae bacterium]|nr:dipeptidase [Chitinophagaceae bacterium]